MCTVSFLPAADGFHLAMNRDELHTRARALPPEVSPTGTLLSLYPREPGGGTWIGVNEAGLAFALLNWYARPSRAPADAPSRGTVIPALLAARNPGQVEELFGGIKAEAMNPFRLVLATPDGNVLEQWHSDGGGTMEVTPLPWRRTHWFSSSVDEPGVNRTRADACAREAWVAPPRSADWLDGLHRSHHPARDAHAICMHREDAATVSYTRLTVEAGHAVMTYSAAPPCERGPCVGRVLPLKRCALPTPRADVFTAR